MTNTETSINSINLARLWSELDDMRLKLNGVIIPLAYNVKLEGQDCDLLESLEDTRDRIEAHFKEFKLAAERRSV